MAEHVLPVALGNKEKPDALYCLACAKEKTKADIAQIRKADRQRKYQENGRGRKRKGPKLKGKSEWPKGRKIPSRGFSGTPR